MASEPWPGCWESVVGVSACTGLFWVADSQSLPTSPHASVNVKNTAFASKGIKRSILLPYMSGYGLRTHPQVASNP